MGKNLNTSALCGIVTRQPREIHSPKQVMLKEIIKKTMARHTLIANPSLSDILEADKWARGQAKEIIHNPKSVL